MASTPKITESDYGREFQHRNGRANGVKKAGFERDRRTPPRQELRQILLALQAMRNGDFSARLPSDRPDMFGKVADTFNSIASVNQRMSLQLHQAGQAIGREGKTNYRVKFGAAEGAWGDMET